MPLVLPVGTANSRFIFSVAGLSDTLGFSLATVSTPVATASSIADSMYDAANTTDLFSGAEVSDEYTWLGVHTTLMTVTGPVVAERNVTEPGTASFQAVTVNSAVLVRKLTLLGGRKNRGRLFFPPGIAPEATTNSAGFLDVTAVPVLQASFDAWYAAMIDEELLPVLLHTDPADEPTVISQFAVQTQLATQRLRMR